LYLVNLNPKVTSSPHTHERYPFALGWDNSCIMDMWTTGLTPIFISFKKEFSLYLFNKRKIKRCSAQANPSPIKRKSIGLGLAEA